MKIETRTVYISHRIKLEFSTPQQCLSSELEQECINVMISRGYSGCEIGGWPDQRRLRYLAEYGKLRCELVQQMLEHNMITDELATELFGPIKRRGLPS